MRLSVLIVDDSAVMRSFIKRILDVCGVEVAVCHQAADGRAALGVLDEHRVDLIFSDINMPVMDGEQLAQELLSRRCIPATPLLVVSTDSTEPRVNRMMELGARGYLRKPFTPEAMREAIDNALAAAREVHQ
jgi:two-component system chemotaxis response regulator CheY